MSEVSKKNPASKKPSTKRAKKADPKSLPSQPEPATPMVIQRVENVNLSCEIDLKLNANGGIYGNVKVTGTNLDEMWNRAVGVMDKMTKLQPSS